MTLKQKIQNADLEAIFHRLGYAYFTNGDYNLNIIGVRDMTSPVQTDRFNDFLVVTYKLRGVWQRHIYPATTDPGLKFLHYPINARGCAILCPGQYRGVYGIDLHRGKYDALCQRNGAVKVYRDSNRNNTLDFDARTIQSGMFGINIHKAGDGVPSQVIGGHSAGCQVFQNPNDFEEFMKIAKTSRKFFGNRFTYTLLTSDQL